MERRYIFVSFKSKGRASKVINLGCFFLESVAWARISQSPAVAVFLREIKYNNMFRVLVLCSGRNCYGTNFNKSRGERYKKLY